MDKNPNWEMTPTKIKEVMDALDKAKDSYEVFGILATDDEIDKNHSLQWLAGWHAQQKPRSTKWNEMPAFEKDAFKKLLMNAPIARKSTKNHTPLVERQEIREDAYKTMADGITHLKKFGLITENKQFKLMDALSDKYYYEYVSKGPKY